jgi:predicted nucleic acid-binding protein
VIYLDSSAIVKLILEEAESADLRKWLSGRPTEILLSSTLFEVEVPRALRRASGAPRGRTLAVMTRISRREMTGLIRNRAATLPDPAIRSLDAIHLSTALELGGTLTAFVAYDRRLVDAALRAGLPVASPGVT